MGFVVWSAETENERPPMMELEVSLSWRWKVAAGIQEVPLATDRASLRLSFYESDPPFLFPLLSFLSGLSFAHRCGHGMMCQW